MFKKIAVAATLAVLASSSFASERGLYAGADFGTTDWDGLAGRSSSFGSFIGYQVTRHVGVEANVRRLINTRESFTDVRVVQTGVSVLGTLPLSNGMSLFARLGYNHLEGAGTRNGVVTGETLKKTMYGFGAAYAFTPVISGRVELQRPTSDSNNVSAAVVFKF